jgi:hypothetical protein
VLSTQRGELTVSFRVAAIFYVFLATRAKP